MVTLRSLALSLRLLMSTRTIQDHVVIRSNLAESIFFEHITYTVFILLSSVLRLLRISYFKLEVTNK